MGDNPFYGLVSLAEAAELCGGLDPSALRHAISRGNFRIGRDCQKFGKQWVFTVDGLERYCGRYNKVRERYEERYGEP